MYKSSNMRNTLSGRVVLTAVFTLSFISYMTDELNTAFQAAPLVLFAIVVFCKLFWSEGSLEAIASLFDTDGLLYVLLVSVLMLATSLASDSDKSFETALIIAGTLVLARIYFHYVEVEEMLDAFFWSGIFSTGLLITLGFSTFLKSVETLARFSPFSFHPNLLGFLAGGYFCGAVWKFTTSRWLLRVISGFMAVVCLGIVFFASSRGSLLGIAFGGCIAAGMALMRARQEHRLNFRWSFLLAAAFVLGVALFIQQSQSVQSAYDFTDKALAISDASRGVDSGFTGRFEKWGSTLNLVSDGTWLVGRGIRSSDSMQDKLIDNGYLVLLYEIGLVPLVLITWRYLRITRSFIKEYWNVEDPRKRQFYIACTLLMVVFLTNNIVARYLFGVGNSYSLFAIFLFAAPNSQSEPGIASDRSTLGSSRKLEKGSLREGSAF